MTRARMCCDPDAEVVLMGRIKLCAFVEPVIREEASLGDLRLILQSGNPST